MQITSFLETELILLEQQAKSSKAFIDIAARAIAGRFSFLTSQLVFDKILGREKLGSTALGNGLAIPHCRIKQQATCELVSSLICLQQPIEFDAPDSNPVDIFFVIVACGSNHQLHLDGLAAVNRLLLKEDFCHQLRQAKSSQKIMDLITQNEQNHAD